MGEVYTDNRDYVPDKQEGIQGQYINPKVYSCGGHCRPCTLCYHRINAGRVLD